MRMQSLDMLSELQRLPTGEEVGDDRNTGLLARIREMDPDMFSVEIAVGTEVVMESLFEAFNVPDMLIEAHSLSFPNYEGSLHQHYQEILERGPESTAGFISNLKGKVAELETELILEDYFPGYNFEIASDPTQEIWDLQGISADGAQNIFVQVKMGAKEYSADAVEAMQGAPDVLFAVSQEIYGEVLQESPELASRMIELPISNLEMEAGIEEQLGVLGAAAGFNAPDAVGQMLPYAAEVVMGIKLIIDMVSTERDFKAVKLTDRSRVHALKTLVLMSKFGVTTVCATAGSLAGGSAGTMAFPGVGTLAGGIIGGVGGAVSAGLLNRKLRSRMVEIAKYLSGIDDEEFFYLRNKLVADSIGESMAGTRAV